jgi:uncharacterized protein YbjT (DUF2867 family)
MRIAIAGGTGTVGAHVVDELRSRGHEVRVLSRKAPEFPVDLTTGAGLEAALEGCEVVVDATNNPGRGARGLLVDGSQRLLAAEAAAGVGHHVCISIVGCDRAPLAYYRVKVEQERVAKEGPVPWSIVRATQFHELVDMVFGTVARFGVLPAPRVKLQPIAAVEVAPPVADVALAEPLRGTLEVAGPTVRDTRELARVWRSAGGHRAVQLPIAMPGRLGRALRGGALTNPDADRLGKTSFEEWLAAR